jgi:hypothetical protein
MKLSKLVIYLSIVSLILFSFAMWGKTAITNIAGLAVAQSSTKWNNVVDAAQGDNLTTGIMGMNLYEFDGTNFDRARGDTTNGLDVDVTRVSGNVTTVGGNTPTDSYTNPTNSINVSSLLHEFNGTTWDRVRHSFNQSTAGVNANGAGTAVDMTVTPMNNYTLGVTRTAGATDVVEIDLECSGNGTNYFQIATVTSVAGGFGFANQPDTPCRFMRYNVVTVGAGNTHTIQLIATR